MLVNKVLAKEAKVFIYLQLVIFWQFSITKINKVYCQFFFKTFNVNKNNSLRKSIVTLI